MPSAPAFSRDLAEILLQRLPEVPAALRSQDVTAWLGPRLHVVHYPVRGGEWLWGAGADRFTVGEVIRLFREADFGVFLDRFGWAGVHAFSAWLLTAPLVFTAVYFIARPLLRAAAAARS